MFEKNPNPREGYTLKYSSGGNGDTYFKFFVPSDYHLELLQKEFPNITIPSDLQSLKSKYIPITEKISNESEFSFVLDSGILGLSNGDDVITWADPISGVTGINATATYPKFKENALNGYPSVEFTISSRMNFSKSFSTPIFVSYVSKTTGTCNRVLAGLTNNWLLGYYGGYRSQAYFGAWTKQYPQIDPDNQWHIYSAYLEGTLSSFYEDGLLVERNNTGLLAPGGGFILNGYSDNTQRSSFEICELIVSQKNLTFTQIDKHHQYLGSKYNIQLKS